MELLLIRSKLTDQSTIGKLYVNRVFECFTLEDKDRGLLQNQKLEEILAHKKFGVTAIPKGKYKVEITMSARFKKELPILINVQGFEGVRIHPGNTAVDTEGCILVGQTEGVDQITNSKKAMDVLLPKLKAAIKAGEEVTLEIR